MTHRAFAGSVLATSLSASGRSAMQRVRFFPTAGVLLTVALIGTLASVSAHDDSQARHANGWNKNPYLRPVTANAQPNRGAVAMSVRNVLEGRRLFEQETFGGNGRTCLTCHSDETGTVSPMDARRRFRIDGHDPLFVHDGSDDDDGDEALVGAAV